MGESGSGKTTVGLALLGHTRRGAAFGGGSIRVGDVDVLALSSSGRRDVRGRLVSYVPQDPAASLNPALRIGTQLRETLEVHGFGSGAEERRARIAEVMREVALPDDAAYLRRYPHELSGGQQQRIGLAMAFACRPRLIVLDEPTTGLDVTTQAHVLGTVRELAAAHGVAALYVSHDLAVVGTLATRTAVMYAGRIVELGPTAELFASASHPYTRRLVQAIPHLSGTPRADRDPRPGALAGRAARGLHVRAALHVRDRRVPRGGAPAARARAELWVRCIRAEEVRTSAVHRSGRLEEHVEQEAASQRRALARARLRGLRRGHRRARRQPPARAARVPGAGRRVGVGQDHAGALDRRPAPRSLRPDLPARTAARRERARRARARRGRRSSTSSRTRTARSTRARRSARSCASRSACSARRAAPRPTGA